MRHRHLIRQFKMGVQLEMSAEDAHEEQDGGARGAKFLGGQAAHRAVGCDGHEVRSRNFTVGGTQDTAARLPLPGLDVEYRVTHSSSIASP